MITRCPFCTGALTALAVGVVKCLKCDRVWRNKSNSHKVNYTPWYTPASKIDIIKT